MLQSFQPVFTILHNISSNLAATFWHSFGIVLTTMLQLSFVKKSHSWNIHTATQLFLYGLLLNCGGRVLKVYADLIWFSKEVSIAISVYVLGIGYRL